MIISHKFLVSPPWSPFFWQPEQGPEHDLGVSSASAWPHRNGSVPEQGSSTHSLVESLLVCFCGIWATDGQRSHREGNEAHLVDITITQEHDSIGGGEASRVVSPSIISNYSGTLQPGIAVRHTFLKVCYWKHLFYGVLCSKSLGNTSD